MMLFTAAIVLGASFATGDPFTVKYDCMPGGQGNTDICKNTCWGQACMGLVSHNMSLGLISC